NAWRRPPGLKPGRSTRIVSPPRETHGRDSLPRLAEQAAVIAQPMLVADPAKQADAIEVLEDLDRPLAPQLGGVAKARRGHHTVALGRKRPGDAGQLARGVDWKVQVLHHLMQFPTLRESRERNTHQRLRLAD